MKWALLTAAVAAATPIRLEDVRQQSRANVQALNSELDRVRASANTVNVRSGALPQIQITAGAGYDFASTQRTRQPIGTDGGVIVAVTDSTYPGTPTFSVGATLNQAVLDIGRWEQISQAARQEDAARGQAQEQSDLSEYEAVRRFYVLYSAERSQRVLESTAVRSKELLERAQALFTAGRGSKSDVLAAQVNLNNDRISAVRQRITVTQSSADLSAWLARSETEDLTAVEPEGLQNTPAPQQTDIAPLLEQARSHRPLLRQVREQLRAAEIGVDVAKSGYIPRIGLNVNYSRSGFDVDPVFTDLRVQNYLTAGLGLSWDVFNGLATVSQTHSAEAQKSQAQNTLEQTQRDVEGSIRIGATTLDVLTEVLLMNIENQKTASQGLVAAQARFSAGAGSTLDVRDAQIKLAQSELSLLQSRADVEVARASLARLTGTLNSGAAP